MPIQVFCHDDALLALTYFLYRVFVVFIIGIPEINCKFFNLRHFLDRLLRVNFSEFEKMKCKTVRQEKSCLLFSYIENAVTSDLFRKEFVLDDGYYNALFHHIIRFSGFQWGIDESAAVEEGAAAIVGKVGDLHFNGQKLAGIGFRFDIHDALFIQYPVTQINRIGDFNVTNRVIFSLKDNVQQTDECRAWFLGIASVDAVKDIVVIKRHTRAVGIGVEFCNFFITC